MKKATIILVILLSALVSNADAQNLTKEQCLKYICDMGNEYVQNINVEACPLENFRLEYDNIKYEKNCKDGLGKITFNLSGLYIEQDGSSDWYQIKNSKGEVFISLCSYEKPSQKDRQEKLLKALKYLSQFATKDPFAN